MKFKVGDVCVLKQQPPGSFISKLPIGEEVTIRSVSSIDVSRRGLGLVYETDFRLCAGMPAGYEYLWARECDLERKEPPRAREQLGEWELCPWRPVTAPVTERA